MDNEQKILELLETMQGDMKMMRDDIDKVRQSQARMERDYGEKLAALFDGQKMLLEKLDDHTARLERIEAKIESHDVQIRILDKTKANRKAK